MFKTKILVSSDSSSKGEREDLSGKKIEEILKKDFSNSFEVLDITILPDEKDELINFFKTSCLEDVQLILTTGGTGFSARDVMPEAMKEVVEKDVPGIPEAMRYKSLEITDRAMLSRAKAGIRNNTLIINLPGSPKAIEEMLTYILPSVEHGIEIMLGLTKNCARK